MYDTAIVNSTIDNVITVYKDILIESLTYFGLSNRSADKSSVR